MSEKATHRQVTLLNIRSQHKNMYLTLITAAFIGFMHSLAPGHWLPVVLMTKSRRWSLKNAFLGACVAASGHALVSITLGIVSLQLGAHLFTQWEHEIESYGGILVATFGLIYAVYSYFRHSHCHGHEHHGPRPEKKTPYLFLFSIGLSPCVAVLPVFVAASPMGWGVVALSMIAFVLGVLASFAGATLLTIRGLVKLDHPLFEHYGDVITGLSLVIMGLLLFLFPHSPFFHTM